MGNAVNVGAAAFVFRRFVEDNDELIKQSGPLGPELVETVLAPESVTDAETTERSA